MRGVTMYQTQLKTRPLGQTGLELIDEDLDTIEGGTR
jgi:hypothetical protein